MKWISVKDRMPKNDQKVLVYDGCEVLSARYTCGERVHGDEYSCFHIQSCEDPCYGNWDRSDFVTHWMELPLDPLSIELLTRPMPEIIREIFGKNHD